MKEGGGGGVEGRRGPPLKGGGHGCTAPGPETPAQPPHRPLRPGRYAPSHHTTPPGPAPPPSRATGPPGPAAARPGHRPPKHSTAAPGPAAAKPGLVAAPTCPAAPPHNLPSAWPRPPPHHPTPRHPCRTLAHLVNSDVVYLVDADDANVHQQSGAEREASRGRGSGAELARGLLRALGGGVDLEVCGQRGRGALARPARCAAPSADQRRHCPALAWPAHPGHHPFSRAPGLGQTRTARIWWCPPWCGGARNDTGRPGCGRSAPTGAPGGRGRTGCPPPDRPPPKKWAGGCCPHRPPPLPPPGRPRVARRAAWHAAQAGAGAARRRLVVAGSGQCN